MNILNSRHYYNKLHDKIKTIGSENMSLAEHAEMWYYENVFCEIPDRDTPEWEQMYDDWIAYAFKNI